MRELAGEQGSLQGGREFYRRAAKGFKASGLPVKVRSHMFTGFPRVQPSLGGVPVNTDNPRKEVNPCRKAPVSPFYF